MSPCQNVPVVPFLIPTPSPQTWPPSPPRPCRLCPHPHPVPTALVAIPIPMLQNFSNAIYKSSASIFSVANVHLTVSCLFHNIKLNIKIPKEVHVYTVQCTMSTFSLVHGQSQSPCRKSSPSTEGPDSCDCLSSSVRSASEKDRSYEVIVAGTPRRPQETRATASKQ